VASDIQRYRDYKVIDVKCWRSNWGCYTEFCVVVEDTDKLYVDVHGDKAILVIGIRSGATVWDIVHELLHIIGLDEKEVIETIAYMSSYTQQV